MAIWPRRKPRSCRRAAPPAASTFSSTRSSARSVSGSSPSTRAWNSRPSSVVSATLRAPCTTWLLVSARPSGEMMTPEPAPALRPARADVDAHDARADAVDDAGDDARIGVERGVVVRRRGQAGAARRAFAVERVENFGSEGLEPNMPRIWERWRGGAKAAIISARRTALGSGPSADWSGRWRAAARSPPSSPAPSSCRRKVVSPRCFR